MAAQASTARRVTPVERPSEPQELPDYCARPTCRRAFTRTAGPGRPQAFCSEVCRRAAEKELRQARSRLAHVEAVAEQLRIDIAAFGRASFADNDDDNSLHSHRAAADAVARVAGILAFLGDSPEPLARELRALHDAVAPVVTSSRFERIRRAARCGSDPQVRAEDLSGQW